MSAFHYYQIKGGEESWQPVPVSHRDQTILDHHPMFMTVLAVSKLVVDLTYEEKLKLAYMGPLYADFDSENETLVIEKTNEFLSKLEELGVNLAMCRLFTTGGRGYHVEVPVELFMEKVPKNGVIGLPSIYREMALELSVDTLDLTIYSTGRGRMWRQPNVQRDNGRYKVPVTVDEMRSMSPELATELSSQPREPVEVLPPSFCVKLSIEYSKAMQKVEDLLKRRAKFKPDPHVREKAGCASIQYMMAGLGIKAGVGFQQIATQLAIAAVSAEMSEERFIVECSGLIENHQGDGSRYGSPQKRADELRRMHRYMNGNPCYEFSVGAIKTLLNHPAPDLDGITTTKEDVKAEIELAATQLDDPELQQDEYADVAKGVTLSRYGIYVDGEFGKKRICAVSFDAAAILMSKDSDQIIGYDAVVLVNGKSVGSITLESDMFSGLVPFNRFVSKYGHAFQGTDAQVRTVMMRFVEQAKRKGNISYVVDREGLDMITIPQHEDVRLREPFMIWADGHGVRLEPEIEATGLKIKFAGYPDPRGMFKTDISNAPALGSWLEEPGNKQLLADTLGHLFACQKPEVLGKALGWYVACFWKQLFQKHYGKFPLLHINGPAGLGKTEMQLGMASMFYWRGEPRPLSPGSTNFALLQHLIGASSIPLILDEYKPHVMQKTRLDQLKGLLRDVYNQRDQARGGGSRESDDYRVLQFSQMAAPMVFIAEAAEEEAAVMERVVLVTLARPHQAEGLRRHAHWQSYWRNRHLLGILGQYIAMSIVQGGEAGSFVDEFDAMYGEAKRQFMLSEEDLKGALSAEQLREKQNTKERPVYNHTVARFGMKQFRNLVNEAIGPKFDGIMAEMEQGVFARLHDLHAATTPEYIKVLSEISSMSHHIESDRPEAIRKNYEYAFVEVAGKQRIEIAVRSAYQRYRMHCRASNLEALFGGFESFAHALQDCGAFVKRGTGEKLQSPGVFTFDADDLTSLGVDVFKSN
jgi:hypothetical protein